MQSRPCAKEKLSSVPPLAGCWWRTTCAKCVSGKPRTTREREILQLFAEGKVVKEIASILDLSLYTVETHRSNIFQKLNLHSTAELILYAVRKGVIDRKSTRLNSSHVS